MMNCFTHCIPNKVITWCLNQLHILMCLEVRSSGTSCSSPFCVYSEENILGTANNGDLLRFSIWVAVNMGM